MAVFKGNKTFYDYEISDIVGYNLQSAYNYGLLEIGAFTIVSRNSADGALKRVSTREYEGLGPSWIWESGVRTIDSSTPPFPVSGIYFNNNFLPNGTVATSGTFASSWYVDYRNGRVIFASGVPANASIKCDYCIRDVAVYLSDSPEWKTILSTYQSLYDGVDHAEPSGVSAVLKKNKVWLPCMVINVSRNNMRPLQLGGGEIADISVFYHVFSDNPKYAKRLCDLAIGQDETNLNLFDVNAIPYPLNYNGSLSSGAIEYPTLAARNSPYFWTYANHSETNGGFESFDGDLYRGIVNDIVSVYRYNSTY